ncbi:MAG: hypothetical protein JSS02_01195 [Planctomycetes bacterium]|nr:hypothetical protein [Planctomycetota bacterium]
MSAQRFELWLARRVRQQAQLAAIVAAILVPLGLTFVWLTYWVTSLILLRFSARGGRLVDATFFSTASLVALGVVVATFLTRLPAWRRELHRLEFDGSPGPTVLIGSGPALARSLLGWSAAPQTALSFVKMGLSSLCLGPATLHLSYDLAKMARTLWRFDAVRCAPVVSLLYQAGEKVPFSIIFQKLPTLDPQAVLAQLQPLDGIVFRTSEPAGLSLSAEFSAEIEAWNATRRRTSRERA